MDSFSALFSDLNADNSSARVYITSYTTWAAYQNNEYITNVKRQNDDKTLMTFEHVDTNTWRYNFPNSQSKITVKFTSETSAEVHEESRSLYTGNLLVYQCDLSYTITKQPDSTTPSPDEYDISVISGTWTTDNGTGTATENDSTFEIRVKDFSAAFSNIQSSGSSAQGYVKASSILDIYQDNEYVRTDERIMSDSVEPQPIIFEHIETNTWRYFVQGLQGKIKITSETTAEISEEGTFIHKDSYNYQCTVSYNAAKQTDNDAAPSPDPDEQEQEQEYDISILSGTWLAGTSSRSGTARRSDGEFYLSVISVKNSFSDLQNNNDSVTMNVTSSVKLDITLEKYRIENLNFTHDNESVTVDHVDTNMWCYTFPNSENTVTVHFISEKSAEVEQEGSFNLYDETYQYSLSYTLTKR